MREEPFQVAVGDGAPHGHRAVSDAPPALLLHGGPAMPDYMEGCAAELDDLLATIRYTQRGTRPSEVGPPYSVESHMADAVAVLDALEVERAWVVGHSWGGFLALHLAVNHPDRLLGLIAISTLGAISSFEEFGENQRRGLSAEQVARLDEVEELRRRGKATEADLMERGRIIWPGFFADPAKVVSPPEDIGLQSSADTNASIGEHYARETLTRTLPGARLPAFFIHGADDPMPVRSSLQTAQLIPGAEVEIIDRCGHFPWWERPGEVRRAVEWFLGR